MSNSSSAAVDSADRPHSEDSRDTPRVALSPAEWEIVSGILSRHLPGRQIWAYGSRARGTRLKKYSDLDLAIEGPPLSLAARSDLAEAFDESDLPFKVDIVEAESLEPEFRRRIESDKVLLKP
jgi:type I restriction enzyme S subunit